MQRILRREWRLSMKKYEYLDDFGTFKLENATNTSYLYFPLAAEEGIKNSITPYLAGDSTFDQNHFLLSPVSVEELHNNKNNKNQRSLEIPLSYNLVNDILQIQMCYPTNCSMIIVDSCDSVIIDQTYPASTSIQVDLSALPSGSYYLYIYAYDCWWLGEFEL